MVILWKKITNLLSVFLHSKLSPLWARYKNRRLSQRSRTLCWESVSDPLSTTTLIASELGNTKFKSKENTWKLYDKDVEDERSTNLNFILHFRLHCQLGFQAINTELTLKLEYVCCQTFRTILLSITKHSKDDWHLTFIKQRMAIVFVFFIFVKVFNDTNTNWRLSTTSFQLYSDCWEVYGITWKILGYIKQQWTKFETSAWKMTRLGIPKNESWQFWSTVCHSYNNTNLDGQDLLCYQKSFLPWYNLVWIWEASLPKLDRNFNISPLSS